MTASGDLAPLSLRAAMALLGLTLTRLWLDCLALGGGLTEKELGAAIAGELPLPRATTCVVEQALNERCLELGLAPLFGATPPENQADLLERAAREIRRSGTLCANAKAVIAHLTVLLADRVPSNSSSGSRLAG